MEGKEGKAKPGTGLGSILTMSYVLAYPVPSRCTYNDITIIWTAMMKISAPTAALIKLSVILLLGVILLVVLLYCATPPRPTVAICTSRFCDNGRDFVLLAQVTRLLLEVQIIRFCTLAHRCADAMFARLGKIDRTEPLVLLM